MLGGCMIAGTVPKPKPPVARCSWSSVCTSSNRLAKVSAWQTTGLFWEGRQEPEWTWDRQYPAKTCDFANSVPWLYRAWGCWRNLKWRIAAVGQNRTQKRTCLCKCCYQAHQIPDQHYRKVCLLQHDKIQMELALTGVVTKAVQDLAGRHDKSSFIHKLSGGRLTALSLELGKTILSKRRNKTTRFCNSWALPERLVQ